MGHYNDSIQGGDMATKVTKATEEEPGIRRQRAAILRFLVEAQRTQGVTLQSLAVAHDTQRSNLSAYIRSEGQRRNIAFERLRNVLFAIGVHWDFTLRGQLHRWDIGESAELLAGLKLVLRTNRLVGVRVMPTAGSREAFIAFLVVETAGDAVCLIRVQKRLFARTWAFFGLSSEQPAVDEGLSDAVQSAWMTKDLSVAQSNVRKLLAMERPNDVNTGPEMGQAITEEKLVAAV